MQINKAPMATGTERAMKTSPTQAPEQARHLTPAGNSECPCGSGNTFNRCCAGNLPGVDIGKKIQTAAKDDDCNAALTAARSDITQYTIWHKTNAVPLVRANSGESPELFSNILNLDVKVLGNYVEILRWCYSRLNRNDEFPAVLERLRSNIDHPRWQRKITYFHALQALGKNWDHEAGKKELKKLGSMDEETDTEILQLYLDLFHNELSFSTLHALTERIANITENPVDRLKYKLHNAIILLKIGDQEVAIQRLQFALNEYSKIREEDKESAYALDIYASSMELLGRLLQDDLLIKKSITLLRQLVGRNDLLKFEISNAYLKLGHALGYISSWQEAKDAYSIAFEHAPHDILKVFMSQCILYLNDLQASKRLMSSIDTATLNSYEIIDYVFIFGQIAIESGEKEYLVKAEQVLRSLEIKDPYLMQYQHTILLSVIDTLRTGPSQERTATLREWMKKGVLGLRRYAKFELSFMGVTFDVGKFLKDFLNVRNTAAKKK